MSSHSSKYIHPLGQTFLTLMLLLSIVFSTEFCEVEEMHTNNCGKALDEMLCSICKNGFNSKDLDGTLYRLRRQADIFPLPYLFKEQFVQPAVINPTIGKRKPSLKKLLRKEARLRRNFHINGKRLRRQTEVIFRGIADECCSNGCTYSDIATYCRAIF